MDFDKDFYKKWKAKSTNNNSRRLLLEDSEISKIDNDKIFSSTALEEHHQTESQFSLRLSDSFVDETGSEEPIPEPNRRKEVIVISDSSSEGESVVPPSKASEEAPPQSPAPRGRVQARRARVIATSSSSASTTSYDKKSTKTPVRRKPGDGGIEATRQAMPAVGSSSTRRFVIEESDSEEENSSMRRIIKDTVAESATLSERKKKEILNWLTSNFESMKCGGSGSSYSQDSVVSDSRKSATSSGNSSLERLEMNFETPNNRGKLTRLAPNDEKPSQHADEDNQRQSRLEKFLKKSKPGQLDIVRDRTPGSKSSDKTPTNKSKTNPKRLIRNQTPASTASERTPMNNVKLGSGKSIRSKTSTNGTKSVVRKIIRDKTPASGASDKTSTNTAQLKPKKKVSSEAQSPVLAGNSEEMPIDVNKNNNVRNNIVIPESESFESKESSDIFEKSSDSEKNNIHSGSYEKCKNNDKSPGLSESLSDLNIRCKSGNNGKSQKQSRISPAALEITEDIVDPSRESVDSVADSENNQIYQISKNNDKKKFTNDKQLQKVSKVPDYFEITDDIDHSDKSPEQEQNDKRDPQLDKSLVHNTTVNTTINDCADILETLYGEAWRNKAKSLISTTEPRKQTKHIFRDVQTEKKINFKKPQFNLGSNNHLSDKENDRNTQAKPKGSQTKAKKTSNKKKPKDSFINDDSTTESSPDCSYYTAISNPTPSQNNFPPSKIASTARVNEKIDKNTVFAICDSESDDIEDVADNWKIQNPSQRKLSFDSSSSSSITSEFDPDDIVPPKTKAKTIKVKKSANLEAARPKTVQQQLQPQQSEKQQYAKKSFLASLSNGVPFPQADFKALTYRNKYSTLKDELCKVLFKLFNEKVFDNQLPEDMSIEWSVRLTGTAGKCYNKQSIKALGKTVRSSRIVLATKVLDSPDRLRDTLIHELCHAATWLINNVSDGHGRFWKAWAHKAMKVFPELPPITRCHDYAIQTKYTYKCTSCGYSLGRHSKSLDLSRKRCGYCHGTFELLINKVTKNGNVQKKSTAQTRAPTGFALFVKENYQLVKSSGAATKHGEVMKLLGQQFSAVKLTPKPGDRLRNNEDESP